MLTLVLILVSSFDAFKFNCDYIKLSYLHYWFSILLHGNQVKNNEITAKCNFG